MSNVVQYACSLYIRAWGSSSISQEGSSVYESERSEAKWIVDCLKWSVRSATLGVFSGCSLLAASSLGASTRTIQILTYSTLGFFGASGAALFTPFAKAVFAGAFVGGMTVVYGYSQLPFPARIAARPFLVPALVAGAALGVFAWNLFLPPCCISAMKYAQKELAKDYKDYQASI